MQQKIIQFQENSQTDRRTEGWADSISLAFLATTWGPTSTTAVDWHSKIQTKNDCLTLKHASMQKNNLISYTHS